MLRLLIEILTIILLVTTMTVSRIDRTSEGPFNKTKETIYRVEDKRFKEKAEDSLAYVKETQRKEEAAKRLGNYKKTTWGIGRQGKDAIHKGKEWAKKGAIVGGGVVAVGGTAALAASMRGRKENDNPPSFSYMGNIVSF